MICRKGNRFHGKDLLIAGEASKRMKPEVS